jgi:hypothetical protein
LSPPLRTSTPVVVDAAPASMSLRTVTGSSPLSVTVVDTVAAAPAATVVANTPSGTFGRVTTMIPSCMLTRAPGVCATTVPSLKPFVRPKGSTTSELSDMTTTLTTRCGSGADRGGAGAVFVRTTVI